MPVEATVEQGCERAWRLCVLGAAEQMADTTEAAADVYAELNRVESEASAIEELALDLLEQSARVATQAAADAGQWVDEARDRTRNVSPQAKERSAIGKRTKDSWMGGLIAAAIPTAVEHDVDVLVRVKGSVWLRRAQQEVP